MMHNTQKAPLNNLRTAHKKDLIVPRLFEEKRRDTVFGFPWGFTRFELLSSNITEVYRE